MVVDLEAVDALVMLAGALVIDVVLGEPPRLVHPVVWTGKLISLWEKAGINRHPLFQFVFGMVMTLFTVCVFAIPAYFFFLWLRDASYVAYIILGAIVLKFTFSLRELWQAALEVKRLLGESRLDKARSKLRSLVARDTTGLSAPLVVSATVESVAENASDSFVAPLFYFLVLGVPGAIAYRVINTVDAMTGYRGKYEYLGKFTAKLDDFVNLLPARLTALLLVMAAFVSRRNGRSSWQVMLRDHARTESPNAGWPMSSAAGALGVQLENVPYYRLGEARAPLVPQTIDAALGLVGVSALVWVIVCFAVEVVKLVIAS